MSSRVNRIAVAVAGVLLRRADNSGQHSPDHRHPVISVGPDPCRFSPSSWRLGGLPIGGSSGRGAGYAATYAAAVRPRTMRAEVVR